MEFFGESIVTDYNGDTVALADSSEKLLFADINFQNTAQQNPRPNVLKLGIRDY